MKQAKVFLIVLLILPSSNFADEKDRPLTPEERQKVGESLDQLKNSLPSDQELKKMKETLENSAKGIERFQEQVAETMGASAFVKQACNRGTKEELQQDLKSTLEKYPENERPIIQSAYDKGWNNAKKSFDPKRDCGHKNIRSK
jgi:hypothetical protein